MTLPLVPAIILRIILVNGSILTKLWMERQNKLIIFAVSLLGKIM